MIDETRRASQKQERDRVRRRTNVTIDKDNYQYFPEKKQIDYHVLSQTLRLIIGTWEGDSNSFSANILNAVARLIVAYGDSLDDDCFKSKLGAISIKQLSRNAKERRPGCMGFAEAMVIEYNAKKKGNARLPLNKLYAKENALFAGIKESLEQETTEPSEDDSAEEPVPVMDQQEMMDYFELLSPVSTVSQGKHAI